MTTTRTDFSWDELNREPHKVRRDQILALHPHIKQLIGPDPRIALTIFCLVVAQLTMAYYIRNSSSLIFFTVAYIYGGTISHMLSLGVHEVSHCNAFSKQVHNVMTGILANLGQGLPSAETFKKYHLEHHLKQGSDGIDVDIPTEFEAQYIRTPLTKFIFIFLQPLFYSIRPMIVNPKPPGPYEIQNFVAVLGFDALLVYFWGFNALLYLLSSTLMGLAFHPVAGHFISEHYLASEETEQETYSYYGPLNIFAFNVGYHNEHHDFPRVSGFRLPQVKKIASEFYDNLEQCDSWPGIIYRYIFDPSLGPYARMKRYRKLQAGLPVTAKSD